MGLFNLFDNNTSVSTLSCMTNKCTKITPKSHHNGPCDLRPLYLTIPCILRLDISDTTCIFSV